jgi:hypothetical protein
LENNNSFPSISSVGAKKNLGTMAGTRVLCTQYPARVTIMVALADWRTTPIFFQLEKISSPSRRILWSLLLLAAQIAADLETVIARISSRGRPIGSGKKGFCSPHLFFLSMNHFLYLFIFCLFLYSPQVSYVEIPFVGQITHVRRWGSEIPGSQRGWLTANHWPHHSRNMGHSSVWWWRNATPFFVLEDEHGTGLCERTN